MSLEDQHNDCKSLRQLTGKRADWDELAKDCVCFANGQGGRLLIGIEDGEDLPPASQSVPPELLDRLRKRINERTVNVQVLPQLMTAENGGQYIELRVSRALGVASTTDGRYFLRVSDECHPVVGDDVLRLANERAAFPWESMTTLQVPRQQVDPGKLRLFCEGIRASDRVKESVKDKADEELLDHYLLVYGDFLTNLGVLVAGRRADRARLGTAPVIQFINCAEWWREGKSPGRARCAIPDIYGQNAPESLRFGNRIMLIGGSKSI